MTIGEVIELLKSLYEFFVEFFGTYLEGFFGGEGEAEA